MKTFVTVYAVIEIVSEFSQTRGGIAHLAHLGGFYQRVFLYPIALWQSLGYVRIFATPLKRKESEPGSKNSKRLDVYSDFLSENPNNHLSHKKKLIVCWIKFQNMA